MTTPSLTQEQYSKYLKSLFELPPSRLDRAFPISQEGKAKFIAAMTESGQEIVEPDFFFTPTRGEIDNHNAGRSRILEALL